MLPQSTPSLMSQLVLLLLLQLPLLLLVLLLLLLLVLLMPPSGNCCPTYHLQNSPTKVANSKTLATLNRNTWLCNPKRPFTCSMFKLFLFRRLIFSEFLWFSHDDPSNFDPGETRKTQSGYAQF